MKHFNAQFYIVYPTLFLFVFNSIAANAAEENHFHIPFKNDDIRVQQPENEIHFTNVIRNRALQRSTAESEGLSTTLKLKIKGMKVAQGTVTGGKNGRLQVLDTGANNRSTFSITLSREPRPLVEQQTPVQQEPLREYIVTWFKADLYTENAVCIPYGRTLVGNVPQQQQQLWFGAFIGDPCGRGCYSNWPLEPTGAYSQVGGGADAHFKVASAGSVPLMSGIGGGRLHTLAEGLFFSTDGWALLLDDLHPWFIHRVLNADDGPSKEKQTAHFCLSVDGKRSPYTSNSSSRRKQTEVHHAEHYSRLRFRILMGASIGAVARAALGGGCSAYAYARRPSHFNAELLKAHLLKVDSSEVQQPPPGPSSPSPAPSPAPAPLSRLITTANDDQDLLQNFEEERFKNAPSDTSLSGRQPRLADGNKQLRTTTTTTTTARGEGEGKNRTPAKPATYLANKQADQLLVDQLLAAYKAEDNGELLAKYPAFEKTAYLGTAYRVAAAAAAAADVAAANLSSQPPPPPPPSVMATFAGRATSSLPIYTVLRVEKAGSDQLQETIRQLLTLSVAGYPLVALQLAPPPPPPPPPPTADEGNHQNRLPDPADVLRFLQLAVFVPGPLHLSTLAYWQTYLDGTRTGTRRDIEGLIRVYDQLAALKIRLAQQWISRPGGEPMLIRPMWYAAPDDPQSWPLVDQFMLGPDLVAVPVFRQYSEPTRKVFLPAGTWKLMVNGKPTAVDGGGRRYEVPVVDQVPSQQQIGDFVTLENLFANQTYYFVRSDSTAAAAASADENK